MSTYEGEHSCVLYVEGKIVRQEEVRWPYLFFYLVPLIYIFFISLGYMVDSCRYKSRVIEGATAILADWQSRVYARFDPGVASDGYGKGGRPCRLVFTLPQMQAPVMVTVQVQIPAGALPGSTFSVAAPGGGAPVQVFVPPGAVPGRRCVAWFGLSPLLEPKSQCCQLGRLRFCSTRQ